MKNDGVEDTVAADSSGTDETLAGGGVAAPPPVDGLGVVSPSSYASERMLGRGGMGQIRVATDRRLRRIVAIKELLADRAGSRARFLREAEITAQLQHPAIVPVYEAGYWPDGAPFYAMKLVDGRPLRLAIEAAATARERLALLPGVVAVADALAYAHARRVVHRDIKPDNILVGDYGETIVIDWGLARRLDDDDDGEAGAVVGTPAYMAPEQARGEGVDERADVYALGAVLYQVLTGTAPYADSRSAGELLERLLREPPRPVRDLAPDAPADLLAIVDKAMAREPADRYPSARDLAEDLHRFTTGQLVGAHNYSLRQLLGRWGRRHRTALAVGAVAAIALIVVGVVSVQRIRRERTVAEQQRAEARAHRQDVESLLDFMLTDLRTTLAETGNLRALEAAAGRARDYFTGRAPDAPDDLARYAEALINVGSVLADQGHTDDALATLEHAGELADRCAASAPDHARCYQAFARSRVMGAERLQMRSELDRGDQLLGELRDRPVPAGLEPDIADLVLGERLRVEGHMALARGAYDDAWRAGNAALEPRRRRMERDRADDARVVDVVNAHLALATVARRRVELEEMRAQVDHALAVLEEPLARAPASAALRDARAGCLDRLGSLERQQGRLAESLAAYQASRDILADLSDRDPSNVMALRNLAVAEGNIARASTTRGDLAGAAAHAARATAILESLHQRDPRNTMWTRDVSAAYDESASIARERGDLQAALALARRSVELSQQLVALTPDAPEARRDLGLGHATVAEVLGVLERWPEAAAARRAADEQYATLIALQPDVKEHRVMRGEGLGTLGFLMLHAGDRDGGIRVLEGAWTELDALVRDPAATDAWRLVHGIQGRLLGTVLLDADRRADAIGVLAASVAALDALAAAQPDEASYAQELAFALAVQARALDAPATRAQAVAAARRARALITTLVERWPDSDHLRGYRSQIDRMTARLP